MKITCSCGNVFNTGSTLEAISIEICSACHPFYTGQLKMLDTARRVEKFGVRAAAKKEDLATGHAAKLAKQTKRLAERQAKREAAEKAGK